VVGRFGLRPGVGGGNKTPGLRASAAGVSTPLLLAIGDALGSNLAGQEWRTDAACRGQDPAWWHPAPRWSVAPAASHLRRLRREGAVPPARSRPSGKVWSLGRHEREATPAGASSWLGRA
jgi:hypothetical protein